MSVEFSTKIGPGFLTKPTFESMNFPAGEAHVKVVNDENLGRRTEIARVYGHCAEDLFILSMWADSVRARGDKAVLLIPYLPGARADKGTPNGAKVYADHINSLGADQVICFDPHSPVMPGLINNLTVINSTALIRQHVVGRADSDEFAQRFDGIIAPDAGAYERAKHVADACHLPLYQATKSRNPGTGKLSEFNIEPLPADGRYLIVDDIADGGGTFIGLAAVAGLPREQLGLWVSHGVFSGKAQKLEGHFGEIYTTDSIRQKNDTALNYASIPLHKTLFGAIK